MEDLKSKQAILSMLKPAPWIVTLCVLTTVISILRGPVSLFFLLGAAAVGLTYGIILILAFLKSVFGPASTLGIIFIIFALIFAKYAAFDGLDSRQTWWVAAQFFAIVWGVSLSLGYALRHRMARSVRAADAEQIVGREAR